MVTTAISPAPGEQEPEAKISPIGRVFGVLFSPTETYKDIVQKPNWIVPLLILTAFSMVLCYFLVQKVDWAAFQRKQIESSSFTSNLTQEQKDQAVERNVKFTVPITYAAGLIGPVVSILIITLVYWGSFNVFKGAGLKFGTAFAIVNYAYMPAVIGAVLTIIVVMLKRAGEVDPTRIAVTSLGNFLPGDAAKWLVALGSSIDLLWFWTLALLGIGFAAANPRKITTSSAFSIVIGMWIVFVLIKVGIAAMF